MRRKSDQQFRPTTLDRSAANRALYTQLVADLRERIANGSLPVGSRLPSELDLAETYDVSRGTIRQAISFLAEEGLLERVKGSGTYVRGWLPPAPSVEPVEERRIGVVMVNLTGQLSMGILNGIQHAVKQRGYRVSLTSTHEMYAQHVEQARDIARLRADQVAGFIIFPVSNMEDNEAIRALIADGVPVVLVDRYLTDIDVDFVVSDNFMGGYRATEHLIILGHRRIGFIYESLASLHTTSVHDRWAGYRQALQEYSLPYDESLVLELPEEPPTQLHSRYHEYLRQPERPTAVFAVKDLVAVDVMQVAQRIGLRVPEDVALIGFDNLDLATYVNPPLTTVAQDGEEIGQRAAHLLLDRVDGFQGPSRQIRLPVNLLVRESCGAKLRARNQHTP